MKLLKSILLREEFKNQPPVLFDIGASGEINKKWKQIAQFCICIAFDPDDREMSFIVKESKDYKKLIVFNTVVSEKEINEIEFNLTRSPFCSSTLEPDIESLNKWIFRDLFYVEKKIRLKSITINKALQEAGLNYIDWLKLDTQGTDIRLLKSISKEMLNNVLAIEVEPGIIDAYKGEDKLYDIMKLMDNEEFFMSSLVIKGTQRLNPNVLATFSATDQFIIKNTLNYSPGWGETTYLNTLKSANADKRSFLLSFVFALIENQYGFANEIADAGLKRFNDDYFSELKLHTLKLMKGNSLKVPALVAKKILDKVSARWF